MTYLLCDLSQFQAGVDFRQLKRSGVAGVMIRASYGAKSADTSAVAKAKAARAAGLRVGFYHYAYPGRHYAAVEAANFVNQIKACGGIALKDLRPMLDMEEASPDPKYGHWSSEFNQHVQAATGTMPLFYSYGPYIAGMHLARTIGAGLVLAAYGRNDGKDHPVDPPAPWKHIAAHQFTSTGRIPGVHGNVDLWHATSLRPLLAHPVIGPAL